MNTLHTHSILMQQYHYNINTIKQLHTHNQIIKSDTMLSAPQTVSKRQTSVHLGRSQQCSTSTTLNTPSYTNFMNVVRFYRKNNAQTIIKLFELMDHASVYLVSITRIHSFYRPPVVHSHTIDNYNLNYFDAFELTNLFMQSPLVRHDRAISIQIPASTSTETLCVHQQR